MSAQYHDTKCLICETTIHAPVENYVFNDCHNDDYSTVADFIVKQSARIAALEAQNGNLAKSLERMVIVAGFWKDTDGWDAGDDEFYSEARALLSEVTK